MEVTREQLKRTEREYSDIAKEPVKAQMIGGAMYFFGSELATLRLFRRMPNMRQGYSCNMSTFFFSVEI